MVKIDIAKWSLANVAVDLADSKVQHRVIEAQNKGQMKISYEPDIWRH